MLVVNDIPHDLILELLPLNVSVNNGHDGVTHALSKFADRTKTGGASNTTVGQGCYAEGLKKAKEMCTVFWLEGTCNDHLDKD